MPKTKTNKSKKISKKIKTSKTSKKPVVETPPTEVEMKTTEVTVDKVVSEVVTELAQDEDVKIELEFNTVVENMKNLVQDVRSVLKSTKLLHVHVNRRLRYLNKKRKGGKKKGVDQKKNPSGFNKPTKISDELAKFLSVDLGTELPRTEVTRRINAYIKEHDLQNPADRREINCDKCLNKLLNPGSIQLSYFNLQTYLSPHFIKAIKV